MHSRTLRVGVIGTEYGKAVHIPALRHIAEIEIVAVCGSSLDRAQDVATRFQIPEYYDDYRAMFTRAGLDAVTIATPPDRHHAAAIAAAEHGLHILCEVPIARSAAEARDMLRLARDARIQHVIAFSTRFTPARIYFKQLISSGYIGDLRSVSVNVFRSQAEKRTRLGDEPSFARATTSVQMLGVNFVDTLRWFFGEIHAVAGARGSIQSRNDTVQSDHEFSSLLQFASGALGTIHVCTDCPVDLGDEIVAVGSGGMLALRGDNRLFGTRAHEHMVTEMTIPDELSSMFQGFVDPRVGPLTVLANEWVHGILQGDCQAPTFEDGMKVQEVVDSIVRSQELSRWIDTSGKKWPV